MRIDGGIYQITTISQNAFFNNPNITGGITLPESITSIGNTAFKTCTGIIDSFWDTNNKISKDSDNVYYLRNNDRYYCLGEYQNVTSTVASVSSEITLMSGTKIIADNCFSLNTSITSVTIPNSVESIGAHAFMGCNRLLGDSAQLVIDGVKNISDGAWLGCSSISRILFKNFGGRPSWTGVDIFKNLNQTSGTVLTDDHWNARDALTYAKEKQLPDTWTSGV